MRKAILPVLGIAAAAAMLAACSSSSKSDGGGINTPFTSVGSTQQQAGTDTGAPSDSNSACQPDVVVQFCETITVTGAKTVSGTGAAIPVFDLNKVDSTCASWVNHQPQSSGYPYFKVPNDPVGGHSLSTQWSMPYQAGSYEFGASSAPDDKGFQYALSGGLMVDNTNYAVMTHGTTNQSKATASFEVKPDGSGTLTFDKLLNGNGEDASDTISGSITWTCVDPQS